MIYSTCAIAIAWGILTIFDSCIRWSFFYWTFLNSTFYDESTTQMSCVGNWPGYLTWNLTNEKREGNLRSARAQSWLDLEINLICLGCSPDYIPQCFADNSDKFICPASACQGDKYHFACSDGKYCIRKHLVCDGYAQCKDESGKIPA